MGVIDSLGVLGTESTASTSSITPNMASPSQNGLGAASSAGCTMGSSTQQAPKR